MHLVILIIGVTLFPQAYALKCYACGDGTPGERCDPGELGKEIVCNGPDHRCAAMAATTINMEPGPYPTAVGYNMKNCLPADQCVGAGTVYFGDQLFSENITCCSTDLCNVNYTKHNHAGLEDNGWQCNTCTDPQNCYETYDVLSCVGDQDWCISVVEHKGVQKETRLGCATKSMCGDVQALLSVLMNISLSEDSTISCCGEEICNDVPTDTAVNLTSLTSLLLLVASVLLASCSW